MLVTIQNKNESKVAWLRNHLIILSARILAMLVISIIFVKIVWLLFSTSWPWIWNNVVNVWQINTEVENIRFWLLKSSYHIEPHSKFETTQSQWIRYCWKYEVRKETLSNYCGRRHTFEPVTKKYTREIWAVAIFHLQNVEQRNIYLKIFICVLIDYIESLIKGGSIRKT